MARAIGSTVPCRHPVPRLWLMTDERIGDGLWTAIRRLPPGSGIVFRHHATPPRTRRALALRIRRIARARSLMLVIAGTARLPGDGVHGRACTKGLRTWPAHDRREGMAGVRAGADALFVSPVFATRSHPDAPAIGAAGAVRIGRGLGVPLIALGGVTAHRWPRLRHAGFYGWAAIDALAPPAPADQKRKAVPR